MVLIRLKRFLSIRTRARIFGRWAIRYWGGLLILQGWWRDRRFGASCGGTIQSPFAHQGATRTESCTYRTLDRLFSQSPAAITPSDVLVDIGCGKGRVINHWLMHHRSNRIYGVELTPEVGRWTGERLASFDNVSILIGDAAAVAPADGTLFFLFNPFGPEVMSSLARRLIEQCDLARLRIIYLNARQLEVFDSATWDVRELDSASPDRAVLIRHRDAIMS